MSQLFEVKELVRSVVMGAWYEFREWREWRSIRREHGCTCHMGVYELSCKWHTDTVQCWQDMATYKPEL
jgi:hypothetical protein